MLGFVEGWKNGEHGETPLNLGQEPRHGVNSCQEFENEQEFSLNCTL